MQQTEARPISKRIRLSISPRLRGGLAALLASLAFPLTAGAVHLAVPGFRFSCAPV